MKKIIRWICDISGVTSDIRKETYEIAGNILINHSYWFSSKPRTRVYNALTLYGMRFMYKHSCPDVSVYRDKLDELGDERIDKLQPVTFL